MKKSEWKILWEIQNHSNIVPGIRNQMDTGAATRQRYDLMEQAHLINNVLFDLCQLDIVTEDWEKQDYKDSLNENLEKLRQFKKIRDNESWSNNSQYRYNVMLGSW